MRACEDLQSLRLCKFTGPFIGDRDQNRNNVHGFVLGLVEHAAEIETEEGKQLGIYAAGVFFPLGPVGAHEI